MYPEEIIKAFGAGLGLDLETDASGSCTFSADSFTVTLTALQGPENIALTADLGDPPPEKLENLYRLMLESNYLFNATGGATLSINGENGHIVLCCIFPCRGADADAFPSAVERFVNVCESWSKIVAGYRYRVETSQNDSDRNMLQGIHFLRV